MKTSYTRICFSLVFLVFFIALKAQMPEAIRITPEDASGFVELTLTYYPEYACVNSGGVINAQYYLFEYMDVDGIYVHNGATVGSSNDFSNGTFANGFATGTSLKLENDVAINEYINNISQMLQDL